jgi:transposase
VNKRQTPEPTLILSPFWQLRQPAFVALLATLAPNPTGRHAKMAMALEAIQIESDIVLRVGRGRRGVTRKALARAFVIKSLAGYPTTKALVEALINDEALRALCGFWKEIPSESTFSRAFAEFARTRLGDISLERLSKEILGEQVVLHVARDSTAIAGRERRVPKPKTEPTPKQKPGPKKGLPPQGRPLTRQQRQLTQSVKNAIAELPIVCNVGTKRNSKGHDVHWVGFKFHVDVTGDGLPISAVTTSASVHDSQVAIPLMRMTAQRTLAVCYQLMDSGYLGKPILQAANELGQVPIVAPRGTSKEPAIPLDSGRKAQYDRRTAAERFFADLKDNRGGSSVRVKGHAKVHLHLMFGLLAIFAVHLLAS